MILAEKIYVRGLNTPSDVTQIEKVLTSDGYITANNVLAREIGADGLNCFYKNAEGKRKKIVAEKDEHGEWWLKTIGAKSGEEDGLLQLPRIETTWG